LTMDRTAASQPVRREWEAEHDIDQLQAAALIGRQFPELRQAPVETLATGWDNTVFLVDGRWVFRFPRREMALDCLARETAVLPRLAGRLPLAIPVPELIGQPSGCFPWPFWGARLIRGQELAESGLADDARAVAAGQLGEFLRQLHAPPLAAEVGTGLPRDPMRRTDPTIRAVMARERLARLAEIERYEPDPALDQLLAEGERVGPTEAPVVLVHGDLHARHLLVGSDGAATGVIDWGDACLADPAADLALAYAGFVGPARSAFFTAYGCVDGERELRARVLAVFLSAALADYAASTGRPALLTEALAGLRHATR
jgi:aminoglycoside phosphotransferase (APT) family kinase protein